VTSRNRAEPPVRVIRFSSRIARQFAREDARLADRVVCDTIANGSRRPTGRLGALGGPILRFEKTFPRVAGGGASPGARSTAVAVLGELLGHGCVALRLLRPAVGGKNWEDLGFLIRAGSK